MNEDEKVWDLINALDTIFALAVKSAYIESDSSFHKDWNFIVNAASLYLPEEDRKQLFWSCSIID